MLKKLALLPLILLTACGVTRTGSGSLSDGTQFRAERIVEPYVDKFQLVSDSGYVCVGEVHYKHGNTGSAEHPFSLTCDNGMTGQAKVIYPSALRGAHTDATATVEFRLSNGQTGMVRT